MDTKSLEWLDPHPPEPAGIRELLLKGGRQLSKSYSPDRCLTIYE